MADGTIGLPPDGAGKMLDTEQLVVGGNTIQRERMQLAGAVAAEIARVLNSDPGATDYGLVVRPAVPVFPVVSPQNSTDLLAGTSVDLDGAVIASGKTGKLMQVLLSSAAACKWEIKKRNAGVDSTIDIVFTSGLSGNCPSYTWRPPHENFAQQVGNGIDNRFKVTVTSLDASNPSNVYSTFSFNEV